jgi:putative hydrolase of the HAD superfamily
MEITSEGPTAPLIAEIEKRLAQQTTPAESGMPRATRSEHLPLEPRPRVVSFDCWGTLISEEDWHWAHMLRIAALQQAAREAGVEVPLEAAQHAFEVAWHRHQDLWRSGQESGAEEIAGWGLAELGLAAGGPILTNLIRRFEGASHTGQVQALEGACALLEALSEEGVPCVLVCDTGLTPGRVVRRLLDGEGLLAHLAVQIFSDEVGAPKPDPRPFLAAIEPFDVVPSQVVHVGDLRRTDVAGARALGMRSIRIRARHDDASGLPEADYVVDSHAELAGLLGIEIEAGSSR